MSEVKLFGKMIQLASNDDVLDAPRASDLVAVAASEPNSDHNLSCSSASVSPKSLDDDKKQSNAETDSAADNPGTPIKDREESESSIISQEERPAKKPDKILPCPRCNSNDTKFCYFNNYNLNQPRHFCKNCQRYWTAGGAVRNVPVGSGRRKTKSPLNPPPHCVTNGLISPETEQLPKKSFHGFSPNCFPAPPWYPAQWGPVSVVATPSPFWSYEVASSPLGKHSREGDLIKESGATKPRVLVPKTLRIDDPSEAAKSSIWATLGIRNEKGNPIGSGGVFGGFRSKGGDPNPNPNSGAEGSLVLQANPAAFSRSLRFHESAE